MNFNHTPVVSTISSPMSSAHADVTSMPQHTADLSNDDIFRCFTAMSSLNFTAENEITISYVHHIHSEVSKHKVNSRHGLLPSHKDSSPDSATGSCSVSMEAPPGKVLSILFLNQTCSRDNQVRVRDTYDGWNTVLDGCSPWMSPGYDVTTANRSAIVVIDLHNLTSFFTLTIQIKAVAVHMRDGVMTRYASPVLGYIQTPGWHPFTRPSVGREINDSVIVVVPSNHATLISVVYAYGEFYGWYKQVCLLTESRNRRKGIEEQWAIYMVRPNEVLLTDLVQFRVKIVQVDTFFWFGVRVLFSFHQASLSPHRHPGGLWNCSVPSWPYFRHHFVCNLKAECAGQEDEMWCPDTSCEQGGIKLDRNCYILHRLPNENGKWYQGNNACKGLGAAMASFPTVNSWYHLAVLSQLKFERLEIVHIGLWSSDNSFSHIIICPDKHWTQDFLAYDAFSACCRDYDVKSHEVNVTADNAATPVCEDVHLNLFKALFPCQNGASSVPYSLVCNHLQDCADNSDEDFCLFQHCSATWQYKCTNGQCLHVRHHCDEVVQCVDESDEVDCVSSKFRIRINIVRQRPPVVADFDGRGSMVYTSLTTGMEQSAEVCPDTHLFCPGDGYCLPVYVRCNGVYDCPGREDEVDCKSYTCPGLYRCRGLVGTCLHPKHLCDGLPQCPQHDDELFCNLTCPVDCTCLGHAFTCTSDFQVEQFSRLRYLDVSNTGLKPGRLVNNTMLVYLNLANCAATHLDNLTLPNVMFLDLSDNQFSVVTVADFKVMKNLQHLSLARNPLSELFPWNYSSGFLWLKNILHVDLSGVEIKVLDIPRNLPFPGLLSLNLSGSGVTRLIGDGFRSLTLLHILDLRGCPMTVFPRYVFKDLKNLHVLFVDNYKLCCEASLPAEFNLDNCQAPFNEISSCDALLRADVYRVCLFVLAALALSGNLGCFSLRIFSLTGRVKTGFNVFVTHLCVSDFVMGVYMAIVGVADRLYLGRYLWEEDRWRHSVACQVAGVLALLSSEVSALIICLITLDRFLVIRFPFSRLRFSSFTAQVASLMTWTVGIVLAAVPLLPVTAYRHFYGQTGICVPLPVTRKNFDGHHYAFGVMILLNFVLFVLIATGQISVYLSMTNNAMSSIDMSRKSRDLVVARRLITVVVSDFLCWFPLGLLGVLAAQGVPVPSEVNVAMAIFVLPLNSALNPFLYTLNLIQEKRQRATEVKLLKLIMDRGISNTQTLKKE